MIEELNALKVKVYDLSVIRNQKMAEIQHLDTLLGECNQQIATLMNQALDEKGKPRPKVK